MNSNSPNCNIIAESTVKEKASVRDNFISSNILSYDII